MKKWGHIPNAITTNIPSTTIDLNLGDKMHSGCVLDSAGTINNERTINQSLREFFDLGNRLVGQLWGDVVAVIAKIDPEALTGGEDGGDFLPHLQTRLR